MFDVITIGGATRDIFFDIPEIKVAKKHNHLDEPHLIIPYGEKLVSNETNYSYGGGAVNVATGLSRLGLKTAAFCNIGKEGTGDMVVRFLESEKVNTSLVQRDKILHTGLSVIVIGPDGEHTGFLERGADNHLRIEKPGSLKKTKWFYVSSLTGDSEKILPEIFNLAAKNKIKIAFNPGSQQLAEGWGGLKKYLAQTDILFLNCEEAEKLIHSKTGHLPKKEAELLAGVKSFGAKISVVTEGESGSHVIFENHTFHQGAYPKEVADTTGAGDAFGAAFLFGIVKNFDLRYSLKVAAINSASVVSELGSTKGLLSYDKIKKSKWL